MPFSRFPQVAFFKMFFLLEDGRFNEWNLHYFRPLEAHPLLSRLEKKIRKSCVKSFQAWNAKFVRMPRPSKSTAIVLEARSWPTRTPKNRRRKRLKHHTSWMKPLRIKKRMLGWNHDDIQYIVYINQPPVFFSGRNGGLLTVHRDLAPVKPWFFFSKTHPFFQSSNWTPNLLVPIFFWGLGLGVPRKNPCPPRKKNQVETHEAKCLVGSPWRLSDVGHPSKLGALDLGSYMAFGGFERPVRLERWGAWNLKDPYIYIYIVYMFIYIYIYCIHTPLKFNMVHPKISHWKRRFLVETIIFRFHVKPWECIYKWLFQLDDSKIFKWKMVV